MNNALSSNELKKNHNRIWKKIKPISESIESVVDFALLNSNQNDHYRLTNLKMQYIRGLIFAESERYVSAKKPTKEGYVIDYYAVEYCFQKLIINNYKRNKAIVKSDLIIREEAHSWAYLGIHPNINDIAKKSYKKGNIEIMKQFAILMKDKNLDFDSPAVQFLKKNYAIIIAAVFMVLYFLTK